MIIKSPSSKICQGYKACGIILYKKIGNDIYYLFQLEKRKGEKEDMVIHFIGGKKENNEYPLNTVVREFLEETNYSIKPSKCYTLIKEKSTVKYWIEHGKYILYISKCPNEYYDIDVNFNLTSTTHKLIWIKLDELKNNIKNEQYIYISLIWKDIQIYNLSRFVVDVIKNI